MARGTQQVRDPSFGCGVRRAAARAFDEDQLGLAGVPYREDGSYVFRCAASTALHVSRSTDSAGGGSATSATWLVDDVEQVVDELRSNGVELEHYTDETLPKTDPKFGAHEPAIWVIS
jgi:hypothetical protein